MYYLVCHSFKSTKQGEKVIGISMRKKNITQKESPPIISSVADKLIKSENNALKHYKVYKRRWFMLYLLVMCIVCNSIQYVQYTIIADVVVDFYGVTYEAVDWSIMICMVLYIPLNILGIYAIQKIGSRTSVIISISGASLATWIKLASVDPHRYWVVLVGQGVVAIAQILIIPLPTQFASTWFGKDQVGLASGIALSGVQLGAAIGFVLPPMFVKASKDKSIVARNMPEPPTPPSRARQQLEEVNKAEFKESTKRIFKNHSYCLLFVALSINGGIYNTIPTLLNQIILYYFPGGAEDAGRIGFVLLITAIMGSTVCGFVLDKFKQFKVTTVLVFVLFLLGMLMFSVSLVHSITTVYITSIFLGTFMSATNSIGLQVAAELTYPEPESISSGYLLGSAEIMGIVLVYLYSFIFYTYGGIWANVVTCIGLSITSVMVICIPFKLKRQAAHRESNIK